MPLLPAVQPMDAGVASWAKAGATVIDSNRLSPTAASIVMRIRKPTSDALFWIDFGPIRYGSSCRSVAHFDQSTSLRLMSLAGCYKGTTAMASISTRNSGRARPRRKPP